MPLLRFQNWDRVFFEVPTLGTRLTCILLISQAIISRIPSLFSSLRADSLTYHQQILKTPQKTIKHEVYCTINQSINLVLISKLDQGVFLATRRIATGSGFEHAGGTPLPIIMRVPPPPRLYVQKLWIVVERLHRRYVVCSTSRCQGSNSTTLLSSVEDFMFLNTFYSTQRQVTK